MVLPVIMFLLSSVFCCVLYFLSPPPSSSAPAVVNFQRLSSPIQGVKTGSQTLVGRSVMKYTLGFHKYILKIMLHFTFHPKPEMGVFVINLIISKIINKNNHDVSPKWKCGVHIFLAGVAVGIKRCHIFNTVKVMKKKRLQNQF